MATKSKITETTTSAPAKGPEAKLSEALETLYAGQDAKALELLNGVCQEALEAGNLALARRARTALMSLARKGHHASKVVPAPSEMTIQVHLNRGEAQEALSVAEKAIKTDQGHSCLHYLKAVALAQLGQAEPSAEALRQALALEPGLHHQFFLEKDFDSVRATSVFAEFERI